MRLRSPVLAVQLVPIVLQQAGNVIVVSTVKKFDLTRAIKQHDTSTSLDTRIDIVSIQ